MCEALVNWWNAVFVIMYKFSVYRTERIFVPSPTLIHWNFMVMQYATYIFYICIIISYHIYVNWSHDVFQWTHSSCSQPDPSAEQFCHCEWWRRFTNHYNIPIDRRSCDEDRPSQGSCHVSQGQHCGGCTRLGSGGHLGSPIFLFLQNF